MKKCTPLAKRMILSSLLGLGFGLLCFTGFSSNPNMPADFAQYQIWSLTNVMLWSTVISRLTLGFAIGLAGTVTKHPIFKFKFHPILRGTFIGLLFSLPMGVGALMGPDAEAAKAAFWIVLIAGGVIGLIIDLIATKLTGQGQSLLDY